MTIKNLDNVQFGSTTTAEPQYGNINQVSLRKHEEQIVKVLPCLQGGIYARLEKISLADRRAKNERQRTELCWGISQARKVETGALQDMWRESSNAPRRLCKTARSNVAMQGTPFRVSQTGNSKCLH